MHQEALELLPKRKRLRVTQAMWSRCCEPTKHPSLFVYCRERFENPQVNYNDCVIA